MPRKYTMRSKEEKLGVNGDGSLGVNGDGSL